MKTKIDFIYRGEHRFCWPVFLLTIGIAIFGIIMVYSASLYTAEKTYGDAMFFATKQIVGVILGIASMIFCYFVNYQWLRKIGWVALIVGFVVLAIVFIPGVGIESYGARRWIGFGSFSFQASEIAKFCFIIFAATYMATNHQKMGTFKGALPVILAGAGMCLLIILEPNMSITICVGVLMVVMLLVGGMRLKHLILMAIPALALIPVLIILEPYRLLRLMAFLDPWASPQGEGFQLIQSLYSLGAGGWFGVGLFDSRQKYSFLPFSESDFIFSIIGEELGFVGCLFLVGAFVALIYYGFKIAIRAKDRFGCYLATGITTILAVQVVLNIAVVTGSIPPTGLPLPLISAGSTSLIMFMAGLGILLNIYRQSRKQSL
ncbi:MAG: putative lipid II flippase FtsW [Clostridia bacterium]|nr:putative lipid II flippase FtsW [Clostridia bacterium]